MKIIRQTKSHRMAYFRQVGRAFGADIKEYISVNLGQLEDDIPKTAFKFKIFEPRYNKKKLEKGIACGYRTQQMSKISLAQIPNRKKIPFYFSFFSSRIENINHLFPKMPKETQDKLKLKNGKILATIHRLNLYSFFR